MFPSSVEEGKLWPKAMAGVVRPARVPTTPRWLPPALPLLIQGGELFLVLMSLCVAARHTISSRFSPVEWKLTLARAMRLHRQIGSVDASLREPSSRLAREKD